jgi:hypothetical protein
MNDNPPKKVITCISTDVEIARWLEEMGRKSKSASAFVNSLLADLKRQQELKEQLPN